MDIKELVAMASFIPEHFFLLWVSQKFWRILLEWPMKAGISVLFTVISIAHNRYSKKWVNNYWSVGCEKCTASSWNSALNQANPVWSDGVCSWQGHSLARSGGTSEGILVTSKNMQSCPGTHLLCWGLRDGHWVPKASDSESQLPCL